MVQKAMNFPGPNFTGMIHKMPGRVLDKETPFSISVLHSNYDSDTKHACFTQRAMGTNQKQKLLENLPHQNKSKQKSHYSYQGDKPCKIDNHVFFFYCVKNENSLKSGAIMPS